MVPTETVQQLCVVWHQQDALKRVGTQRATN